MLNDESLRQNVNAIAANVKPIKTILEKAQDIVYNRKSENGEARPYGPFSECMKKATEIFNAINPGNPGHRHDMAPHEMYFALIALKLAREHFQHKQDNLTDACGYLAGLDDFINTEMPGTIMTQQPQLRFAKVRKVSTPSRGTKGSAGLDFYVPADFKSVTLYPGDDILIPSGIMADIPEGYMLLGVDKSGIATSAKAKANARKCSDTDDKPCLIIGAKLVDEDYQGEIHIHIINVGRTPYKVVPYAKIAQFVLVPVLYAEPVEVPADQLFNAPTERGTGGFSSTGK